MHPNLPTLYDLQLADNHLRMAREQLVKLDRGEALQRQIVELRKRAAALAAERSAADQALKSLEAELAGVETRIQRTSRRLNSGEMHNVHEVESAEKELATFHRRQGELEEKILGQMEALDVIPARAAAILREEKQLVANLQQTRSAAEARAAKLEEDIAQVTRRRESLVQRLPEPLRIRYEKLRQHHEGVAVVRIVNGGCDACRVAIPTSDVKLIVDGDELVSCRSCGRYLYTATAF